MVIVGHSYAIAPQPPHQDLIIQLLHFDYSGSLAVKFFFFLSGLLVGNSILTNPSVLMFGINRALRIYPGLFICLLITILAGCFLTNLPIRDYIHSKTTWDYLVRNMVLIDIQWTIPSVLEGSKNALNGSLWTLPFEIRCYLYLMILSVLGGFSLRWLANAILCALIVIPFVEPAWLPGFGQVAAAQLLPACFAIGVLFSLNKNLIQIGLDKAAGLWLLVILVHNPIAHQFLFYLAFFYSCIVFASYNKVIKYLKLPFDASYGVYIYGFPVQQIVFLLLPTIGVHGNQLVSASVALALGIGSWFLVERPAMVFGKKIIKLSLIKVKSGLAQ